MTTLIRHVIGLTLMAVVLVGHPAVAQQTAPSKDPEALLGMARVRRDAGDLAGARRYFEEARRARPFDTAQLTEYFWVVAGQDSRVAIEVGREVLRHTPGNQDVRDRLITESISLGDEASVVSLASEGQRLNGSTARWPRRLGESYLRQSQPANASAAYAQAVTAPDATVDDRAMLALSLEASQRYAEASSAWDAVPAAARTSKDDWNRSRLRAVAHSATTEQATSELEAWLQTHADDHEMRELLNAVWRRQLAIARGAGQTAAALAALNTLSAKGFGTAEDRWTRVDLLIASGDLGRAAVEIKTLQGSSQKCSERLLTSIDRMGDRGTAMMLEALAKPGCQPAPKWITRGIDRAVAASLHKEALTLIARLPVAEASRTDMQRLAGQLHLWTGDAQAAIRLLEPVVRVSPNDAVARESLIDAYRADHRPDAAWRTAEPMLGATKLSDARVLSLAELALEADRPDAVASLLDRLPAAAQASDAAQGLRGRALLAVGRPSDARITLGAIPATGLSSSAALAFVDSTRAVAGPVAARDVARRFDADTPEWRDVLARKVMLETIAGDPAQAASLRRRLAADDVHAVAIVDAEVALARQRPAEALVVLATLPNDPQPERAADLESIALAGLGRHREALDLIARLRQARPASLALRVREAELKFQQQPGTNTLAAIQELASAHPDDRQIDVVLARAFARLDRHDDALGALGPESNWNTLPADGVAIAIRSLKAAGRPGDALALLDRAPEPPRDAATLRAELMAQLAGSQWASGDAAAARTTASRTIDLDPSNAAAWGILIDTALASASPDQIGQVIERLQTHAGAQPALAISLADRLAARVRDADDPLAAQALRLLDATAPADVAMLTARDLARSRIFAATQQWHQALSSVDAALTRDPASADALKLRAELLSWSGRHAEALAAYDTYFRTRPADVEARRQQARVAGWAGWYGRSKQMYRAIGEAYPEHAAARAEIEAKSAFFDGRWTDAVQGYDRWIALEPSSGEARFERAESLRAAGHVAEAEAALTQLAADSQQRLAESSLQRSRASRGPTANAVADVRSSNGYDGQRLLDLRSEGGSIGTTLGQYGQMQISADGAYARATGDTESRRGYRAGVTASGSFSPSFGVSARAALWDLSSAAGPIADIRLRAAWRMTDRWSIGASADREPLFENIATIDQRIAGTGGSMEMAFASPRTSLQARLSAQSLTDGNARTRATVSVTRALSDRFRQLRLIGWAESLRYRTATETYFSPSRQLRMDGGAEYTLEWLKPQFRGDRQKRLTGGYLIGFDDDGTVYHHPTFRLSIEWANGLAFDARADWIRSDVYRETSAYVGLRVGTTRRD